MKKFLIACVAAIGGLTTPLAANYDYNCCPPQCDPCCSCSDFNGFYIGGNLGVFSHVTHFNDTDGFFTDNSGWSSIDTSFTAGVQLGYDWQCNSKLAGLVVDWNWVDTNHRIGDNPNGGGTNDFHRHQNDWFTTIRARFGVTVCDALVYVTGGAAVTHHERRYSSGTDSFRDRHNRWGWTAGAGVEYMLGCSWSLGAEFLFLHFSHHNRTFTTPGGTRFAFQNSDSAYVGRILVNYRFGNLFNCCGW